jgi:hypothetical protein
LAALISMNCYIIGVTRLGASASGSFSDSDGAAFCMTRRPYQSGIGACER